MLLRNLGWQVECQLAYIPIDCLQSVGLELIVLIKNVADEPDALTLILIGGVVFNRFQQNTYQLLAQGLCQP
jgi:hypothetical protein